MTFPYGKPLSRGMLFYRRRVRPSLLRRFCALTAVLGLLFAATVASVTHSVAMPIMPAVQMDVAVMPDHHAATPSAAGHDCSGSAAVDDTAADDMPAPSGPCEQGCLLCKSCSLTSVVLPAAPSVTAAGAYHDYQPARVLAPAGITPAQPNEPPRL